MAALTLILCMGNTAHCYFYKSFNKLMLLKQIKVAVTLGQRFSIPVLARPPALHISYVTLIASDVCSIRTEVPCEVDITGYSAMIPVRSEHIYSIQSALKCARRELKWYIFTEVYDVTLVRA